MRWLFLGMLWAVCSFSGIVACGFGGAEAAGNRQGWDHYSGRRVYVTSMIYDFRKMDYPTDARVSVMGRAAAPLIWVEPRVNDSLQSLTEFEASMIRTYPAPDLTSYQKSKSNVARGGDFHWDNIVLGERGGSKRTVCDVGLGSSARVSATGEVKVREAGIFARRRSGDCRVLTHTLDPNTLIVQTSDVARPAISLNWLDERGNIGSYAIEGAMVHYPGPSVYEVKKFEKEGSSQYPSIKAQLLDPFSVCNVSRIALTSLGIQSGRPGDATIVHAHKDSKSQNAADDYFDGKTGRRIAGRLMTCQLASETIRRLDSIELLLSELTVFKSPAPAVLETKVRSVVTPNTKADVSTRAYFRVLNAGNSLTSEEEIPIHDKSHGDFEPVRISGVEYPSAYFIADVADLTFEEKPESRPDAPDVAKIDIIVTFEHTITVERPQEVTGKKYTRSKEQATYRRSCSCRTRSGGGDDCSCSCRRRSSSSGSLWCVEDHVRIEDEDDLVRYKPGSDEAKLTFVFDREVHLEPIFVAFDKPYEPLKYVEPTPIPGMVDNQDYVPVDGMIRGASFGDEEIVCSTDIDADETGWVYVKGVNSQGQSYEGCRPNYSCCADIPRIEEACDGVSSSEQLACQTRDDGGG